MEKSQRIAVAGFLLVVHEYDKLGGYEYTCTQSFVNSANFYRYIYEHQKHLF